MMPTGHQSEIRNKAVFPSPSEEGDAVSRISFSSIVFLVLIGLIGQISQINLIGYGFTLHPPPLKGELEGVFCTYNDNQSPRGSRRR